MELIGGTRHWWDEGRAVVKLVGMPGFEPGTSCTPSRRASQAALHPETDDQARETLKGRPYAVFFSRP